MKGVADWLRTIDQFSSPNKKIRTEHKQNTHKHSAKDGYSDDDYEHDFEDYEDDSDAKTGSW